MAATETSICNQALARLGDERIVSLDDTQKAAQYCKEFYAQTRDEILRSHAWNFAARRETLARLAQNPPFGFSYQYQLPSDFLLLVQLNAFGLDEADSIYEIEGDRLLTNESRANLKYVARIENTGLFDPLFVEALAVKLASKLARPLTGSGSTAGEYLTEYTRLTAPLARKADVSEDRPGRKQPFINSPLVAARRGGMNWGGSSSGSVSSSSSSSGSSGSGGGDGNVIGPGFADDGDIAVFLGSDGKRLKSTGKKIGDLLTGVGVGFTNNSGEIVFDTAYLNAPAREFAGNWTAAGHFAPSTAATHDTGSATAPWRRIYGGNIFIQANGYWNAGTTEGPAGYGLRDNGGTIEAKVSGGAWSALVMESAANVAFGFAGLDGAGLISIASIPDIPFGKITDFVEMDIVAGDGIVITTDGNEVTVGIDPGVIIDGGVFT